MASRDDTIAQLRTEVSDAEERARLCEKKHRGIEKDLKRQLVVERKRADALQERLSEVLASRTSSQSAQEVSGGEDGTVGPRNSVTGPSPYRVRI